VSLRQFTIETTRITSRNALLSLIYVYRVVTLMVASSPSSVLSISSIDRRCSLSWPYGHKLIC